MTQPDKDEVKKLIAESRKGFPQWAKESLPFAIVMAGAVFVIRTYIPAMIDSQTRGMAIDIGDLKTHVESTDESVKRIDASVRDLLSKAFDGLLQRTPPATKKGGAERSAAQVKRDLQLVKSLIDTAHAVEFRANPASLSRVGYEAVVESASSTEIGEIAWQTVVACVNYRSFLNSGLPHPDVSQAQVDPRWRVKLNGPSIGPTGPFPELRIWGRVSTDEGAAIERTGEHLNQAVGFGPAGLLAIGGNMTLSGMHLKNVVVQGVHVTYDGTSPVNLENVFFIDCTFEVVNTSKSRSLGQILLASSKISKMIS